MRYLRAVLFGLWFGTGWIGAAEPPNVLFLLTDDQRADTIAALGNPHIHTPNLDNLVKRGFTFTNAYCMGGNSPAVCSPSRNMLMSGRAYFRFGRFALPDKPNFPDSLKKRGYVTYHHGKRGNTAREIHRRFDISRYVQDDKVRRSGEPGREIVDDAISFLRKRDDNRPFFMYLAFSTPHDPRVAARRYMDEYDPSQIPIPKNFAPFHPFDNGELKIRDEKLAPWPRTRPVIRRHLHDYYAVISGLDDQIGRLISFLKKSDKLDNTLIIFSSDHGLAIGSHGLMGKQNLYEHSMKVPLIFAGPGVPNGQSEAFAYLFDIYPTVCELVGAEQPAGIDGQSLTQIIQGNKTEIRDSVLLAYRDSQRAVRVGTWKLIRYPQIDKSQLFNIGNDPSELNNLASDPAQGELVKQLTLRLRREQQKYGDGLPLSVKDPRPGDVKLSTFD